MPIESPMRVIIGNGNRPLGERILRELDLPPDPEDVLGTFPCGEQKVRIGHVRELLTFIVNAIPDDRSVLETLFLIDAAKRHGATRVVVVIPYFAYAREDDTGEWRGPVSADLVARLIKEAGADRVVLGDPHSRQLAAFFRLPVDKAYARPLFIEHYFRTFTEPYMICSVDAGGARMVRSFRKRLKVPMAIGNKERDEDGEPGEAFVVGDIVHPFVNLIDDMIDTAGSALAVAEELFRRGAERVSLITPHGLFSRDAAQRLADSRISEVVVSDSLPISPEKAAVLGPKLRIIGQADHYAKIIMRIFRGESVKGLMA